MIELAPRVKAGPLDGRRAVILNKLTCVGWFSLRQQYQSIYAWELHLLDGRKAVFNRQADMVMWVEQLAAPAFARQVTLYTKGESNDEQQCRDG